MSELITPAIEKVKVQQATIKLFVDMDLASIPVTVVGQYNIDSNCFYPSIVMPTISITDGENVLVPTGSFTDLEDVCTALGWDYHETHDLIQKAVEDRDR